MNRELPKSLREALARQTADDAHPSADALTAFVEHSLPPHQSQRVTAHLAQCADCREVVFLASSAVEEPASKERELVAAAAIYRTPRPATARGSGAERVMPSAPPRAKPRGSRWRMWWVWAPVVALLLVVSGVVLQKRAELRRPEYVTAYKGPPHAPTTSPQPTAAAPAPEAENAIALTSKATPESPKPVAKSASRQTEGKPAAQDLHAGMTAVQEYRSAPAVAASQPASAALPVPVPGPAKAPPVVTPMQNAFVGGEAPGTAALVAKPQAMMGFAGAQTRWRVAPDGHLEHLASSGNWTLVLTDQPVRFRVVSVVGSNVWAGGNGGALFHSSDGGQNWSRQPLPGETDTIVSIQFSNAAHGIIATDAGTFWSTLDGGVTWTKE